MLLHDRNVYKPDPATVFPDMGTHASDARSGFWTNGPGVDERERLALCSKTSASALEQCTNPSESYQGPGNGPAKFQWIHPTHYLPACTSNSLP